MARKPYPPGKTPGKGRRGVGWFGGRPLSDFGRQLRDKQIVKFTYGLRERQFKNYVVKSMAAKGQSSIQNLVVALESRLDNVVYRLNFTKSRKFARQLVSHGHILVNDRKVTIPSYQVKIGDKVAIRQGSRQKGFTRDLGILLKKYIAPDWLELDKENISGLIIASPRASSINLAGNINAVVEFYSR